MDRWPACPGKRYCQPSSRTKQNPRVSVGSYHLRPDTTHVTSLSRSPISATQMAGIVRSITLGRETRIRRHQAFANGITLLVIGSILAMGGYHFLLFCFRPENLSHLFFCLICLLISLRKSNHGTPH